MQTIDKVRTSIGAMIRESEHAESKTDFIHKLSIALKEANETGYWIELLYKSNIIDEKSFQSIQKRHCRTIETYNCNY